MLQKVLLYWNTVRYMKPSQIYYRIRKMMNRECTLGVVPRRFVVEDDQGFKRNQKNQSQGDENRITKLKCLKALDFDPVFLERFPVEEFMEDKVTFLHETEIFHWDTEWEFKNRTPLWNFNLHYFEYLFPMIYAYRNTGDTKYFKKLKQCITAWIVRNPKQNGGAGWAPYTIALRLVIWMACYTYLEEEIKRDREFYEKFLFSIWKQYDFLARHLEKDLLANHYFEDLKTLVLCSIFFQDDIMLENSLKELKKQCREQILSDGMHFELSPMYHKLILEDMLRVAVTLRGIGRKDAELEKYLQPMLDAAYSMEEGLDRVPLFNDCGNNVAKSLAALCKTAQEYFSLVPKFKSQFPDSGYYIFKKDGWKLIVDVGQPGPSYNSGHAHCDAMSFELFKNGKPVIVNCGTYAYQCGERAFFRSTAAHNTVQIEGVEQSQCWGIFRMGKRSQVRILHMDSSGISIQLLDQANHVISRTIVFSDLGVLIKDCSDKQQYLKSYIHCFVPIQSYFAKTVHFSEQSYAPEFGKQESIFVIELAGQSPLQYRFDFTSEILV